MRPRVTQALAGSVNIVLTSSRFSNSIHGVFYELSMTWVGAGPARGQRSDDVRGCSVGRVGGCAPARVRGSVRQHGRCRPRGHRRADARDGAAVHYGAAERAHAPPDSVRVPNSTCTPTYPARMSTPPWPIGGKRAQSQYSFGMLQHRTQGSSIWPHRFKPVNSPLPTPDDSIYRHALDACVEVLRDRGGAVSVVNLKLVDRQMLAAMRDGEADKRKHYRAVCWASRPITPPTRPRSTAYASSSCSRTRLCACCTGGLRLCGRGCVPFEHCGVASS